MEAEVQQVRDELDRVRAEIAEIRREIAQAQVESLKLPWEKRRPEFGVW